MCFSQTLCDQRYRLLTVLFEISGGKISACAMNYIYMVCWNIWTLDPNNPLPTILTYFNVARHKTIASECIQLPSILHLAIVFLPSMAILPETPYIVLSNWFAVCRSMGADILGIGMLGLCLVAVDVCTNLSLSDIDFLFRRVCDGFLHQLTMSNLSPNLNYLVFPFSVP